MKKIDVKTKFNILAIILICIFAISYTPITFQNDIYYTIKVGETIANNGIDMQDHFSWHENLNYTYPHWLYDLITYIVYSKFNFLGIYILTCVLACIFATTFYLTCNRICKNNIIAFFVSIITIFFINPYITARAQLVTFTLFTLTIYFIEKYLETCKTKYAVGLVVIPIIIANVHIAVFPFYFIFFLPYIVEYMIARNYFSLTLLNNKISKLKEKLNQKNITKNVAENLRASIKYNEKRLKSKQAAIKEKNGKYDKITIIQNDNTKKLIVVMIIAMFAGFVTPLGVNAYTYLIKTMLGSTTSNIMEHLPIVLANNLYSLIYIATLISFLIFTKVKLKLSDWFLLAGLVTLTILSRRQFSILVIVGGFILSKFLYIILDNNKKFELRQSINSKEAIVFIVIVFFMASSVIEFKRMKEEFVDKTLYPVEASEYILENIDLKESKFYNEYDYGSYMLFKGIPVFIDSRADLYDPKFSGKEDNIFMDYMNTYRMNVYYEDTFEKYGITHIIIRKDSNINTSIAGRKDEKYKKLYSDDNFIIYEITK